MVTSTVVVPEVETGMWVVETEDDVTSVVVGPWVDGPGVLKVGVGDLDINVTVGPSVDNTVVLEAAVLMDDVEPAVDTSFPVVPFEVTWVEEGEMLLLMVECSTVELGIVGGPEGVGEPVGPAV